MLRDGWLKDEFEKVRKDVENWPDWMKALRDIELPDCYGQLQSNKCPNMGRYCEVLSLCQHVKSEAEKQRQDIPLSDSDINAIIWDASRHQDELVVVLAKEVRRLRTENETVMNILQDGTDRLEQLVKESEAILKGLGGD